MEVYTTQMDAARKGIATEQMKTVAEKEHMPLDRLMQLVAEGKVAICANKRHKCLDPEGVGSMLRTKINVNLGVSRDCKDYDVEMQKVRSAVELGAEAIMDLSSHGNTQPFRRKLVEECPAMIGTVPVYDSVIHYQRDLGTLSAKDFIDVIRLHAEDGVDFVTLHCGITRKTIDQIRRHKRKMNIVSRGGSLVFAWMSMTGEENPFYEYFDEILDICEEHDVTISLGDACRPGCIDDSTDESQIGELIDVNLPVYPKKGHILITEPISALSKTHLWSAAYIASKLGEDIVSVRDPYEEKIGHGFVFSRSYKGNHLLGGTRENVGFDRSTDIKVMETILKYAQYYIPKLRHVNIIRAIANFRPATPDGKAIVGPVDGQEGLFVLTGHEGDGISLSPLMGREMAKMICGCSTDKRFDEYNQRRFNTIDRGAVYGG